ncbi:MAG: type II secretion system protein [Gemmatimonadaceae bacterium]
MPGFTLIEVMVTLAVLGLVAAFVVPSFAAPPRTTSSLDALRRSAADLALQRAQWLTLRVETDGRWTVRGDLASDTSALASGVLTETTSVPVVLRLSPVGACLAVPNGGLANPCRPADVPSDMP